MKLGNRIKRIRLLKGLKQADICHGIISPTHYSNIENCRYTPSIDTLKLLASRLDVPETYFQNVYEDTSEMQDLLSTLEFKIEKERVEEVQEYLDSHQNQLQYIPSIRQEYYFLLLKFLALVKIERDDQAIKLYENEIAMVEIDESQLFVSTRHQYLYVTAVYHYYVGDYKISGEAFKRILLMNEDPLFKAKISFNIATTHYYLCQFERASKYAIEAKDIYLMLHEWEKVGDCYNLIALLCREMNEFDEAEKYIQKGFTIIFNESHYLKAILHHNYALILLDKKHYEEAFEQIEYAIEFKKNVSHADMFVSLNLRLELLLKMESLSSIKNEMAIVKSNIRTKNNEGNYSLVASLIEFKLEHFKQYEELITTSIEIFKEHIDLKQMKIATEHYANYLAMNKKYKKAFEMQVLCTKCLKKYKGEI
ncbi:helix-turn-helix transcriptional regulator [Viridibacillus sp. YIM B01967]|uniref:Helix-turn-helix transcriptional regulator n=1 Tax=Viridibacillus soli TaxID=2798301 RepID=A0ABS1H6T6_9BACL|nr:helix-turn-helix transcriptional regulator [Viridibacillus soli]MBK3495105.1 helix-turn-helix transcriptional regulator [Viridibacillus soli]